MAKTATQHADSFEELSKESQRPMQLDAFPNTTPETITQREPHAFRWTFAQSICKANHIANISEQTSCKNGVPCDRLVTCTELADNTIRYLETRKSFSIPKS